MYLKHYNLIKFLLIERGYLMKQSPGKALSKYCDCA